MASIGGLCATSKCVLVLRFDFQKTAGTKVVESKSCIITIIYLHFFPFFIIQKQVDRNHNQLQQNATTVMTEIEEMHTRLTSVLRERTEFLKSSVDKYLIVESKTLKDLKENLELELANIKVSSILLLKTYYAKKPRYVITT